MSFRSRAEATEIARQAFNLADADCSGFLVVGEFYKFLELIYERLGLNRPLNPQICQELFLYYDDDGNGRMTPNEVIDMVWDVYSCDIQNDRASIQQMLEKVIIEKLYNRPYGVNGGFGYGNWGLEKMGTGGGWRKHRQNMFGGYMQGGNMGQGGGFGGQNRNMNAMNMQGANFSNQQGSFNNQGFQNQGVNNFGGLNNQGRFNGAGQGGFNNGNQGGFNNVGQGGFNNVGQGGFNNVGQGAFNMQSQGLTISMNGMGSGGMGMNMGMGPRVMAGKGPEQKPETK